MNKIRLQEIINSYYENLIITDDVKIESFSMNRDYFLDVFGIRYERSEEINKPIIGLKDVLESFTLSKVDQIQSTSVEGSNISLIIYTDVSYNDIFGVVNFLN